MRRRPSGSATEEEDDAPKSDPSLASGQGDKINVSLTEIRRVLKEEGNTTARRKRDGAPSPTASTKSQAWVNPQQSGKLSEKDAISMNLLAKDISADSMVEDTPRRRASWRNPWSSSLLTLATTVVAAALFLTIVHSFLKLQLDPKGCAMCYMRPSFVRFSDFDTEHTRFATKYSLYLYREGVIDENPKLKGVPILFVPGNAGSYKQVRPLAAESAYYWHDVLRHDENALNNGKRALDFFSVDFNEDITAFHGQTLVDQAEYLNDAILYILSLYHDPNRSDRDPDLPDPSSVIVIGHSMGGIVARTMLTMPNYQPNSINTIVTLSAPHARPPVSFDGDIVRTYKEVNEYWRQAYAQPWASENPLWHVTLVSIAGGGLDTIVPSDYASIASLVPDTHGFTVFTSSIPNVWTGMDHLAITWCDQLRKNIVRAVYDIMDARRAVQTQKRAERMTVFKKWLLTGLEDVAEKTLPHKEPKTLLTLEDNSNAIISPGEQLVLRSLGESKKAKARLLPVPPQGAPEGRKFTLLTDQKLDTPGENGKLEVLFCSVFPLHVGQSATIFSMNMDLSGDTSGSTRLACKNAASDVITLPSSYRDSKHPFDTKQPFSYLQYDLEELAEHQFVAVVDKSTEPSPGWLVAEFTSGSESILRSNISLQRLLSTGVWFRLPARRPMVVDIKIPALQSSLLAYNLVVGKQSCGDEAELFTPLIRQYITDVHESKFFVNVKKANINLHGVAPYMPPQFLGGEGSEGLSLQVWTDPTCDGATDITLQVDVLGSMGKLWMRYRIVFAGFAMIVVALVLRKQFKVYDETGVFMSFAEGLNQCLKTSLPAIFLALTFFSVSLARSSSPTQRPTSPWFPNWRGNSSESIVDYTQNDLLLGNQDAFFWFLVPLFGLISYGICVAVNYVALFLTHMLGIVYGQAAYIPVRQDDNRRTQNSFALTSTRRRIITTSVLLVLVSTVIPYHFAYMVLCVVQLATCVRAYRLAKDTRADNNYNFYNYAHSILILMLWILPVNLPVLVVWVRNLAVHWLTPFSSHHNILSVMPVILLVETLSTRKMIPRVTTKICYLTNVFLFAIAVYAGIYGVTYAYVLHHLANILCAWLVAIHFSTSSFSISRLPRLLEGGEAEGHMKKRP